MKHVFLSYSHKDARETDRIDLIKSVLESFGVTVWIDRRSIDGGQLWRDTVNNGIESAALFIACVSSNYFGNPESYIRNELDLAFRELTNRNDQTWIIPVKVADFNSAKVPAKYRKRLAELHMIDLATGGETAFSDLLDIVLKIVKPDIHWFFVLRQLLSDHVTSQIEHFIAAKIPRVKQIEDAWTSLLEDEILKPLSILFIQVREKGIATGIPQTERLVHGNRMIILSYVPYLDSTRFMQSLPTCGIELKNRYLQFILENARTRRAFKNWQEVDLVHIIYFSDGNEWVLDVLYSISFNLTMLIIGQHVMNNKEAMDRGERMLLTFEEKYPTYLTNSEEYTDFCTILRDEEVRAHERNAA